MKLTDVKVFLVNQMLLEMKPMTREVLADIQKAISHAVDRLVTDEGLNEAEAKRFVNSHLSSMMKQNR